MESLSSDPGRTLDIWGSTPRHLDCMISRSWHISCQPGLFLLKYFYSYDKGPEEIYVEERFSKQVQDGLCSHRRERGTRGYSIHSVQYAAWGGDRWPNRGWGYAWHICTSTPAPLSPYPKNSDIKGWEPSLSHRTLRTKLQQLIKVNEQKSSKQKPPLLTGNPKLTGWVISERDTRLEETGVTKFCFVLFCISSLKDRRVKTNWQPQIRTSGK